MGAHAACGFPPGVTVIEYRLRDSAAPGKGGILSMTILCIRIVPCCLFPLGGSSGLGSALEMLEA